jgi:hypothetical protein
MEITTFKDDLLGLEGFAERLERFIATEHDYVEGGLVLALTSKFGSGKTTFLRMWKSSLENANNKTEKPLVISLNAWESDYYGDPLFAIISALVERLETKGRSATTLVNAAKDLGWFVTVMGGQVVKKMTGIDAVEAGDLAEKKKKKRQDVVPMLSDTFSIYQGRKAAMDSLKKAIREFVAASEPRVLFLVDELDRCRPDYAITYLETIKHIFDIKGAVFLLAADREQLENSAKTAFGPDLDFEEYYRKFIHREITLPPISETGYQKIASRYVDYYLNREGSRHCFMKLEQSRVDNIIELVGALKLTPRQIQEAFRILGHIFSTSEENKGRLRWCLAVGSILMAVLKIGEPRVFHLLGTQRLEPKEAADFLKQLTSMERKVVWWFLLFYTGGGLLTEKEETAEKIMKRAGLGNEEESGNFLRQNLGQWQEGWGHSSSSRLSEIHAMIEQIYQWK